jgi:hypothetical protein
MTNGRRHNASFGKDFFKRSGFISENYAHSLHGFIVITWDAFPAAVCSSFREHGCDSHNFLLLTLQSCVTLPMRETQPCCLSERPNSSILPWYGARCESKANHRPLHTTHIRPFVARPVTKTAIPPPLPSFYSNHPVRWEGHALPRCWPPQRTQPGNSLPRICEREKIRLTFTVHSRSHGKRFNTAQGSL